LSSRRTEVAGIGVALSGGGHRATLFDLGALLYLADAGKNRDVTSISSVSGGSLTNGYVAQSGDYSAMSGEEFRAAVAGLAKRISLQGTLWASPVTWGYLGSLIVLYLLVVVGTWFLPWAMGVRVVAFLAGLLVAALYAGLRGTVCGRAFATTMFTRRDGGPGRGRRTRLADIATRIDHVICATDLHWGEHVYFSGRFVCSYRFGWGQPGDLPLHAAVQASAALPGAFPPRWVRRSGHAFQPPYDVRSLKAPFLALVDGGVYDNMGDQWPQNVARRNERWAEHSPGLHEPDELVVVNASAPMDWSRSWPLRLPVLGELLALKRDQSVLYDNGTSVRRGAMIARFRSAEREGEGLRGTIVQIDRSPYDVPNAFVGSPDTGKAARAKSVLDLLTDDEASWDAVVQANTHVKTTLSRLGTKASAQLLRHGYVLAMANCHVLLGYPALEVPPESIFEELVS
jgi:predicted acylesterase/phospholipase RssA